LAKRSSMEMDVAVLQALHSSNFMKPTHIMYKANVNAKILKGKLVVLEAKGLIASHKVHKNQIIARGKERVLYGLTSKGHDVLRSYLSVYETFRKS
jgi:predicted transcriptional regulator